MPATRVYPVAYKDPVEVPEQEFSPPPTELINGPISKRSCTDILPCLLLICALAGLIALGVYAYFNGYPNILGMVYDSNGKQCGVDAGYEDYPYLYYPIPKSNYATKTVCVKTCPMTPLPAVLEYKHNTAFNNAFATSNDPDFIATALASGSSLDGAFYLYKTMPFFDRLCVPQKHGTTYETFNKELLDQDMFGQWVSDVKGTWIVIGICLGIAAVLGIVYIFFLRFAPGILFFVTMFLMLAAMGGTGYLLLKGDTRLEEDIIFVTGDESNTAIVHNTILAKKILAYAFWGLCAFLYIIFLFMGVRIKYMNKVMKAASLYVRATPSLFLIAIFAALILAVFFGFWVFVAVYLTSIPTYTDITTWTFSSSKFAINPRYFLVFATVVFFWFSAFVRASVQYIVANSVSFWYYGFGNGQAPPQTIWVSIKRLFRYHMGSIAFGSFILMLFEFLRVIGTIYQGLTKPSRPIKIIDIMKPSKASTGCLDGLGKRIMLMNKTAFIHMALHGKEFSDASHEAYSLVARNSYWIRLFGGIGSIFAFYGRIFIATIAGVAGLAAFTYLERYTLKIYSPILPLLLIVFFAYQIGSIFVTIYGIATDTLLTCFFIDEEIVEDINLVAARCPPTLKVLMLKLKRLQRLKSDFQK